MNEPVTGVLLHDDRTEVMPYVALLSATVTKVMLLPRCHIIMLFPICLMAIDVSIKVLLHDVVTAVPYRVVVIKISSDVVTEVLLNNVV